MKKFLPIFLALLLASALILIAAGPISASLISQRREKFLALVNSQEEAVGIDGHYKVMFVDSPDTMKDVAQQAIIFTPDDGTSASISIAIIGPNHDDYHKIIVARSKISIKQNTSFTEKQYATVEMRGWCTDWNLQNNFDQNLSQITVYAYGELYEELASLHY